MPEGANHAAIVLYGQGRPAPYGAIRNIERAGDSPLEILDCASGDELSAILRSRREAGQPAALVLFDETRENGELIPMLDVIGAASPLTVRAALVPERPAAPTLAAFQRDTLDRLIRIDGDWIEQQVDTLLDRFARLSRLQRAIDGRVGSHVFLTGASGFVGQKLMRELLRCTGVTITALVRSKDALPYDQRLDAGPYGDRVTFVEGEITAPGLGLSEEAASAIRDSVDEIWHLAAITDFSQDIREQLLRVNVEGTAEVLQFASTIPGLRSFNHVSTAYVAGDRRYPERVPERVEPAPPAFKNPYEESKFLAEQRVANSGLPHVIFRPSVIFGESYSGRGDGKTVYGVAEVFRVAKLLADRRRGEPGDTVFRVRARSDASLNLIPVDWVVDEMLRIRAATPPDGSVYHITHDSRVTVDAVHDVLMPLCGIERCEVDPTLRPSDLDPIERFIYRRLSAFRPYIMEADPVFDRANVERAIGAERRPPISGDAIRYALAAFFEMADDAGENTPARPAGAL